jgi:hypothetical protein
MCFAIEDAKCDVLGTGDAVRIVALVYLWLLLFIIIGGVGLSP